MAYGSKLKERYAMCGLLQFVLIVFKILRLFEIDEEATLRMLTTHTTQVDIFVVVQNLDTSNQYLLHRYLHQIFESEMGLYNAQEYADAHDRQIELYLKYDPDALIAFLQISKYVNLDKVGIVNLN